MKKNWYLKKWVEKTAMVISATTGFILATFEDIPTVTLLILFILFISNMILLLKHSRSLRDEI